MNQLGYDDDGIRSAGLLLIADDTGRALLLLRSDEGGSPGVWSIPGGRREAEETDIDAALRETQEETGYEANPESLNLRVVFPPYATYVVAVPEEFEVELNSEHVDAGWFALDDMPVPTHEGVYRVLEEWDAHA